MATRRDLKPTFILASASPRRRSILRTQKYRFRVIPSHVGESIRRGLSPSRMVRELAVKKARWVAARYPREIVLGADTLVFLGGKAIGKPRDERHARKILRRLSGRSQAVWTGVAVAWEGGRMVLSEAAVSQVVFRGLTDKEVAAAAKKHLDKAGAYSVQSKNDNFVTKITGDYDNVVGLPMRVVGPLLRLAGRQARSKPV